MGFVANFVRFPAVENFESRLNFDKVTDSLKVGPFSDTQCRMRVCLWALLQCQRRSGAEPLVTGSGVEATEAEYIRQF